MEFRNFKTLKEFKTKGIVLHCLAFLVFLLFPVLHAPLSILHSQTWGCGVSVKAGDKGDFNQALALYADHRYGEASRIMSRVSKRNPKAAEPQFWLGMISVKNGFQTGGIRRYFTKCIDLCPTYPHALAHFYMGVVHYTDERYEEAVVELEKYFTLATGSDDKDVVGVYEEASAYLHWSQFLAEAILHMAPFDPYPLTGVNTKRNELLPFITHDGQACYYLREVPVKRNRTAFYTKTMEETHLVLCRSEWRDSAFTKGAPMPSPFNGGLPEGGVSLTCDGKTLYFSRITDNRGYANSDLYCARWKEGLKKWVEEPLNNNINGDHSWESQPSVTPDGQWLYFASDRKGGLGGIDIWRCHRLKNGDWSRPENLGPSVNTTGNEKFPFIHSDSHTLYFLSDGWQGFGGYDIYFIDLVEGGNAYPTNLGLPINTENDELSFSVVADGSKAYFPGRIKSSRSTDILMFDLYPAARPEPMHCHHTTVASTAGVYDTVYMLSERNLNTVVMASEGVLPYIACGKSSAFAKLDEVILYDSVTPLYVDMLSGSRLAPAGECVLDAWAEWFFNHPRIHAVIECPKQTDAKAIYDYLLKKKLRAERLSYRGGTDVKHPQLRVP